MNSLRVKQLIALGLFAALTATTQLAGQEQQERQLTEKKEHHHCKLFDIGTLGGPVSTFPSLSNHGVVAGWSATLKPLTPTSNPFICGGIDGLAPFITVAYKFDDGVMTDLGALPGANNCSIPFGKYDAIDEGDFARFQETENSRNTLTNNSGAGAARRGPVGFQRGIGRRNRFSIPAVLHD